MNHLSHGQQVAIFAALSALASFKANTYPGPMGGAHATDEVLWRMRAALTPTEKDVYVRIGTLLRTLTAFAKAAARKDT